MLINLVVGDISDDSHGKTENILILSNKKMERVYAIVEAKDIKVGDKISVNTGYRPLDDEDCTVLDIKEENGMFGDENFIFRIKTLYGEENFSVPKIISYGNNKHITVLYKLI